MDYLRKYNHIFCELSSSFFCWLICKLSLYVYSKFTPLRFKFCVHDLSNNYRIVGHVPLFHIYITFVIFSGRFIWPEKTSATFASINGNLDQKVELGLGRSIKIGDERYKPLLSIMASKLSYENINFVSSVLHNHWKVLFFNLFLFVYNFYMLLENDSSFVLLI